MWAASNGSNASNWVTAVGGGATGVTPGSTTDVTFSATTIATVPTATVLGANMTIKGLTLADTVNAVALNADGNTLTIGTDGITVNSTAQGGTIAAGVALGTGQTWTNNSSNGLTVSGVISGGGGNALTTAGTGTISLTGTNTYTGLTTVSAGILQVNVDQALGTTANGTSVSAGAELQIERRQLRDGGGPVDQRHRHQQWRRVGQQRHQHVCGPVTVATNATINTGGGNLTFTGGLVKTGTVLTLKGGGTVNVNTTGISGSTGGSDLIVDGTTMNLNTADSYNGPTYIRDAGVINATAANALPTTNGRSAIIMDDSGTGSSGLALTNAGQAVASLTGASTSTINLNNQALTVGATSGTTTFAGVISGATGGSLVKDGASTQVLSKGNTYTGGTTVSAGSLLMTNGSTGSATGSGALSVGSSGTIGGIGTSASGSNGFNIAGNVIAGSGVASDTTGQTTITGAAVLSNSTFASGATLSFNLNSANTNSTSINVGTTGVNFGSTTLSLTLQGSNVIGAYTPYVLIAGVNTGGLLGVDRLPVFRVYDRCERCGRFARGAVQNHERVDFELCQLNGLLRSEFVPLPQYGRRRGQHRSYGRSRAQHVGSHDWWVGGTRLYPAPETAWNGVL